MSARDANPGPVRLAAGTNGWLVVRGGRSLLVDCPGPEVRDAIVRAGLPEPEVVLHTHVQEEHCREWAAFPRAAVHVPASAVDIARRAPAFFAACRTRWAYPWPWEERGLETYGYGACTLERPPEQALRVEGVLEPGGVFRWADLELEVLDLPGHGKRSLGLFWREAGILFSGDLLHAGGHPVNLYDLERDYGSGRGERELLASLAAVARLGPARLLPATGPAVENPAADIARLQDRFRRFHAVRYLRAGTEQGMVNFEPLREAGLFREVLPGLWQNRNYGNVVLYVDDAGRGLMVDPDICVWQRWEESCAAMHAELDLLEREAGLRTVEFALATHYHADHFRFAPLLKERYGTRLVATPGVADVMARPERFPYPCLIPWYNLPYDRLEPDLVLLYGRLWDWRGVAVTPWHAPGHCWAAAMFGIPWQGRRTVCTGDALSYGRGPIGHGLPVLYNDTAWPERGLRLTCERLRDLRPDLVLCSHSHAFFDPDGSIVRDHGTAAAEAEERARDLVLDGDLPAAMTPPGFDAVRPSLQMPVAPQGA